MRDASNRWVFRDLGLEPHKARLLLVGGLPDTATHGVDVSDFLDRGVASLAAHEAYLRGLGDDAMADPQEFLEIFARQVGTRLGVRFGVGFEVIEL